MRRILYALALLAILMSSATAEGTKFGIGVSGGLDFPVAQEDQGSGTSFSFHARITPLPILTFEPNLTFTSWGDPDLGLEGVTNDLEGSKVTGYGVDALLGAPLEGPGFTVFGIAGLGFYKVKRDQTQQDNTDLGVAAGLGFALGMSSAVSFDLRGKFHVIPQEEGGSKKSVSALLGLNYTFGQE
jgi:hypothetical protein